MAHTAISDQQSVHCDILSFPTLNLQKQCYFGFFFESDIKEFESERFYFLKQGLFGCCGLSANRCNQGCSGPLGCALYGTFVVDPHVLGLLKKSHQRLFSLHCSWDPCSAPMESLQHLNSSPKGKGPNQRKTWHAQR